MNRKRIVKEIKCGNLVITPTDTVYGILASMDAVEKVLEAKKREVNKPFLLLASNLSMIKKYASITSIEEEIIKKYMPGELTILVEKKENVNDIITAKSKYIGFRIPNHSELLQIIEEIGEPVISTSANLSGELPITNVNMIDSYLLSKISYIEDAGEINNAPSSIIQVDNREIKILRDGKLARRIQKELKFKEEEN